MSLVIEIFRPGRHVAMSGAVVEFTEADLRAVAEGYDAAAHEAPAVLGHPATDDPAFGWVSGLEFKDGALKATFGDLEPAFAEALKDRRYAKVSPALWAPGAKGNPTPGRYALRHVGFLGAAVPGCKGLKPIAFAADDEIEEFAETPMWSISWGFGAIADIFRRQREALIEAKSIEEADKFFPEWMIRELADAAKAARDAAAAQPASSPAFSEPSEDPELAVRAAALDEREQKIAAREEAVEAGERAAKVAERQAEDGRFLDGLVAAGRLKPGAKKSVLAFLATLADDETHVFAEGEAAVTARVQFKAMLANAAPVITFAELGQGDEPPATDAASLASAAAAHIAAEAKKGITVSADVAVRHVQKGTKA